VIKIEKQEKMLTFTGVFATILFHTTEKLLLRQREESGSIIPRKSFRGTYELPGGGVMDIPKVPYSHLVNELIREIREEIGMSVSIDPMPPFHPLLFKGPNGYDLAMVTPIITSSSPTKGKNIWVSTKELNELARDNQVVSGWGKRMHCMALKGLCYSTNYKYSRQANETLREIQKNW
jgi:hypothetical protein